MDDSTECKQYEVWTSSNSVLCEKRLEKKKKKKEANCRYISNTEELEFFKMRLYLAWKIQTSTLCWKYILNVDQCPIMVDAGTDGASVNVGVQGGY